LAVDERRLVLSEMQVDKTPFPVLELNNPKVLLRPDQAEGAKGKNVVIGDPRLMNSNDKILAREVVAEKTHDGKSTLRIIVNAPKLGGQGDSASQPAVQAGPVRPVSSTGQTGPESSPGPSSQNVRKWVLGRLTSQRCREDLQIRDLPFDNC
jgi:hypothetical protein